MKSLLLAILLSASTGIAVGQQVGNGKIRISEITAAEQQQREDLLVRLGRERESGEKLEEDILKQNKMWPTDNWCYKTYGYDDKNYGSDCRGEIYAFYGVSEDGRVRGVRRVPTKNSDDLGSRDIAKRMNLQDVAALKASVEKVEAAQEALRQFDIKLAADRNAKPYNPPREINIIIGGDYDKPIYGNCLYELVISQTKTQLVIQTVDNSNYDKTGQGKCVTGYEGEDEAFHAYIKSKDEELVYTGTSSSYQSKQ